MTLTSPSRMSIHAAAAVMSLVTSGTVWSQQPKEIEIQSFSWGVSNAESLRVCVDGLSRRSGNIPSETDSIFYVIDASGSVALERELRSPAEGFQCTDIPYADLEAVLDPNPNTGAVTFKVKFSINIHTSGSRSNTETIGANETITIGSNRTRNIGAVMNVDGGSGKIGLYQPIIIGRVFNPAGP